MSEFKFLPSTPEQQLTKQQYLAITSILALDRDEYLGRRGQDLSVPRSSKDTSIIVAADGFKLLVKIPSLKLFSKVYWKPEHTLLVNTINQQIIETIGLNFANTFDFSATIGVLDRALIFKYRTDIIGPHSLNNLTDRAYAQNQIQKKLKAYGRDNLIPFVGIPSILELSPTGILLSDIVLDGYLELEQFLNSK